MSKMLDQKTPVVMAGLPNSVKFYRGLIQNQDATAGWQFLNTCVYHSAKAHSLYSFKEYQCSFALPSKLKPSTKVPNTFTCDSGKHYCATGLAAASWILKNLKVIPRGSDIPPGEDVELMILTSNPLLPVLLQSTLPEIPNILLCFTGASSGYEEFLSLLQKLIKDFDAVVHVDWPKWWSRIATLKPVRVGGTTVTPDSDEEEGEGDEDEEAPLAQRTPKKTPSKQKRKADREESDEEYKFEGEEEGSEGDSPREQQQGKAKKPKAAARSPKQGQGGVKARVDAAKGRASKG